MPRESIFFAGEELFFSEELETIDEAQAMLDYWRRRGFSAACTHYEGKHQLYRAKAKFGRV